MKNIWFLILFLGSITSILGQEKETIFSQMRVGGYVRYMNTNTFTKIDSTWLISNLIHNRLNYQWYLSDKITIKLGMRNRLIYGDLVKTNPNYAKSLKTDNGFLHFLTSNVSVGKSYILNTTFDRALIEYSFKNITVSLGRQRINWGQSFVWNPNDIFNSYSFFDFDYEEHQGSDAIRIQYYPTFTSVAEFAVKIDKHNNMTLAGLYRFNKWGYDFQFMGGVINHTDYVIGTGWTGNIKKIGFNGELSYFHPQKNTKQTSDGIIATLGLNFLLKKQITITVEGNYNTFFNKTYANSLLNLSTVPQSVKTISFSKFSGFGQISYSVSPLLSTSVSFMYLPSLKNGYYIMPSIQYSIHENLELSLIAQRFKMTFNNRKSNINSIFLRVSRSF